MKINGTNHTNFNPYKNITHKQNEVKNNILKSDNLQISNEAKSMLEKLQPDADRLQHIKNIKESVQTGKYEINFEKTADKMIDFWTKDR